MPRVKFSVAADDEAPHQYAKRFELQRLRDGSSRLVVGLQSSPLDLLKELALRLPEPFRVLYVLVVTRSDAYDPGRYECPEEFSAAGLTAFLDEFAEFFEGDGRHQLWIASPSAGALVYDRHELIYAYGPLDSFERVLASRGFEQGVVAVPAPHAHHYRAEFDPLFTRLMERWPWAHSPLKPGDEA